MKPTAAQLARVRATFEANFADGLEVGAAASIWNGEEEILSVHGGWMDSSRSRPWEALTLVLIWSATKGLASACVLHALQQSGYPLDIRVADFWPEFGQHGKESITVGQVLSHRAGLSALDAENLSLLDHDGVARAIERQIPQWNDAGHGYGPRTFGFVADEIVRRLSNDIPLGEYFRKNFGDPMALDLWIGLPDEEHERVAQMLAPRMTGGTNPEDAFAEAMATPGSLTRRAFASPGGLPGASAMNSPAARTASIPSLGGIGSASSLAKFYAMLANDGSWNGHRFFDAHTLSLMQAPLSQGLDKVLQIETAFSAGFMKDPVTPDGRKIRKTFGGSTRAFGHPGAGGSLAFADPDAGIGFAYVMNQMEPGVLPKKRALSLVEALIAD